MIKSRLMLSLTAPLSLGLASAPAALAQGMSRDNMKKASMSRDGMSKDNVKK